MTCVNIEYEDDMWRTDRTRSAFQYLSYVVYVYNIMCVYLCLHACNVVDMRAFQRPVREFESFVTHSSLLLSPLDVVHPTHTHTHSLTVLFLFSCSSKWQLCMCTHTHTHTHTFFIHVYIFSDTVHTRGIENSHSHSMHRACWLPAPYPYIYACGRRRGKQGSKRGGNRRPSVLSLPGWWPKPTTCGSHISAYCRHSLTSCMYVCLYIDRHVLSTICSSVHATGLFSAEYELEKCECGWPRGWCKCRRCWYAWVSSSCSYGVLSVFLSVFLSHFPSFLFSFFSVFRRRRWSSLLASFVELMNVSVRPSLFPFSFFLAVSAAAVFRSDLGKDSNSSSFETVHACLHTYIRQTHKSTGRPTEELLKQGRPTDRFATFHSPFWWHTYGPFFRPIHIHTEREGKHIGPCNSADLFGPLCTCIRIKGRRPSLKTNAATKNASLKRAFSLPNTGHMRSVT